MNTSMKLTPHLAAVAATLTVLAAGLAVPQPASATAAAAPVLQAAPITLLNQNKIAVGESAHQAIVLPAGPRAHGVAFHAATPLAATRYRASTRLYRVRIRILDRSGDPVAPGSGGTYSLLGPVVNTAT